MMDRVMLRIDGTEIVYDNVVEYIDQGDEIKLTLSTGTVITYDRIKTNIEETNVEKNVNGGNVQINE